MPATLKLYLEGKIEQFCFLIYYIGPARNRTFENKDLALRNVWRTLQFPPPHFDRFHADGGISPRVYVEGVTETVTQGIGSLDSWR